MLFDLRGRGRRNTIKVIYISLAFLMGGGLVFFGIGGNVSGGGLVDALTGADDGGGSQVDEYREEIRDAEAALRTNPQDRTAYEDLMGARFQLAGLEGYDSEAQSYTEEGLGILRQVAADWDRYKKLDLPVDDARGDTANRAAQAFFELGQSEKYIEAQQVFAEERDATGPYQSLAAAAYQLDKVPLGDKAAAKAVQLATEDQRNTVKADMEAAKAQAPSQQGAGARTAPAPAESPAASTAPEGEGGGAPKGDGKPKSDSKPKAKNKPKAKQKPKSEK